MNGRRLENIYKTTGITDFQLKNTDDLLRVHGVNYSEVEGFNELNQENKEYFIIFLPKFFNVWGLNTRANLNPKSIAYIEGEYNYLRFEYTMYDDSEDIRWLHVKKGGLEWY